MHDIHDILSLSITLMIFLCALNILSTVLQTSSNSLYEEIQFIAE